MWPSQWHFLYGRTVFAPEHDNTRRSGEWQLRITPQPYQYNVAILRRADGCRVDPASEWISGKLPDAGSAVLRDQRPGEQPEFDLSLAQYAGHPSTNKWLHRHVDLHLE